MNFFKFLLPLMLIGVSSSAEAHKTGKPHIHAQGTIVLKGVVISVGTQPTPRALRRATPPRRPCANLPHGSYRKAQCLASQRRGR